jgi:hypothetical protein
MPVCNLVSVPPEPNSQALGVEPDHQGRLAGARPLMTHGHTGTCSYRSKRATGHRKSETEDAGVLLLWAAVQCSGLITCFVQGLLWHWIVCAFAGWWARSSSQWSNLTSNSLGGSHLGTKDPETGPQQGLGPCKRPTSLQALAGHEVDSRLEARYV